MKMPTTLKQVKHNHQLNLEHFVKKACKKQLITYSSILHGQLPEHLECNKWNDAQQLYSSCVQCKEYSLALQTITQTVRPELKTLMI
ncbi:hypothetical protein GNP84_06535 [Aliivibrio fischeri]|uniref:hypothetical protein n=1 Tax=Aliivibrio fischeri TaxID=668 RepID=UPI0012D86A90|nr:hypothetical protein [Aliivibrio fischeri]MUK76562.1 hypothetical protein [Aliivibrio fischeri]